MPGLLTKKLSGFSISVHQRPSAVRVFYQRSSASISGPGLSSASISGPGFHQRSSASISGPGFHQRSGLFFSVHQRSRSSISDHQRLLAVRAFISVHQRLSAVRAFISGPVFYQRSSDDFIISTHAEICLLEPSDGHHARF
jgi:hypothetical protein